MARNNRSIDLFGINERKTYNEILQKISEQDLDYLYKLNLQNTNVRNPKYISNIYSKFKEMLSDTQILVEMLNHYAFSMYHFVKNHAMDSVKANPYYVEDLINYGLIDTSDFIKEALSNNYVPSQSFFVSNKDHFLKFSVIDKLMDVGFVPPSHIIEDNLNLFSNENTILYLINHGYVPSLSAIENGDLLKWKSVFDSLIYNLDVNEDLISKPYFIHNVYIQKYIIKNNPSLLLSLNPFSDVHEQLWLEAIKNDYIPDVILTDGNYRVTYSPVLMKKIIKHKPEAVIYSHVFYPSELKNEIDSLALCMGYVPTINDAISNPYVKSSFKLMESVIKNRPEAIRYITDTCVDENNGYENNTMSQNNYTELFQLALDNGYIPTIEDIANYRVLRDSSQIMAILIKEKPSLIIKITDNTPYKEMLLSIAIESGLKGRLYHDVPSYLLTTETYLRYELEHNLISPEEFAIKIESGSISYRSNYSIDFYQYLVSLNIEPKRVFDLFSSNYEVVKLIVRRNPEVIKKLPFGFSREQYDEILDIAVNEANYRININDTYERTSVSRSYKYAIAQIKKEPNFIEKIKDNNRTIIEELCKIAVDNGYIPSPSKHDLEMLNFNYSYDIMKMVIPFNPGLLLICKINDDDKMEELCQLAFKRKNEIDFEEITPYEVENSPFHNCYTFMETYLEYYPDAILYTEISDENKLIQLYDIVHDKSPSFFYMLKDIQIFELFKNIDKELWKKYLTENKINLLNEMVEINNKYGPDEKNIYEGFKDRKYTENFSKNQYNILCCYQKLQKKIINLSSENDFKLSIVFDIARMYKDNLEWIPILERVLNNIDSIQFSSILSSIENVNLTDEERTNLILLLTTDNDLDIMSYDDLKNIDQIRNNYINDLIKRNTLGSLKTAYFEKVFGISLTEAIRLVKIYGKSLDSNTINSIDDESKKDLIILNHIKTILNINNPNILNYYMNNVNPEIIISPEIMITYEARLKYLFTRAFNKSFTKPNEEDKVTTDVKGEEELNIYLAAGKDGNKKCRMMITSLGAYSYLPEPDDYYASWNIKDLSSHGVCCSYVGERNLGTARIKYCCLGFTDYELGSLHTSGPYDLHSSSQENSFDITIGTEPMYLLPDDLLDFTRHTHNEVVWERRSISGKEGFKKQPSYIVFFCDNFDDRNNDPIMKKQWESVVKASKDFAITIDGVKKPLPIMVVEREKIAKSQLEIIQDNIKQFKETLDPFLIRLIVSGYESNYAGNREYHADISAKYFPQHSNLSDSVVGQVIEIINSMSKTKPKEAAECCRELIRILDNEHEMYLNFGSTKPSFNIDDAIFKVEETLSKLKTDRESSLEVIAKSSNNDRQFYSSDSQYLDDTLAVSQLSSDDVLKIIEEAGTAKLITDIEDEINDEKINAKLKVHGKRHIKNVLLYSTIIAQDVFKDEHDVELIAIAAKYHDVGRKTDAHEEHAEKGSNIAVEKLKEKLSKEDIAIVQTIIEFHETPRNLPDIEEHFIIMARENGVPDELIPKVKVMAEVLKDADALDRTRFINKARLDTRYLKFDISKRLVKFSASVQETYAIEDLQEYQCDDDIFILLQFYTPQEVIRNIRHSTKGLTKIEDIQDFIHSWATTVTKDSSYTQNGSRRS